MRHEPKPGPSNLFWFDGSWSSVSPRVVGLEDPGMWMSKCVFDGARCINGALPDLMPHCERVIESALTIGLSPTVSAESIAEIARESTYRLRKRGEALYIKPLMWGTASFETGIFGSTQFGVHTFEMPIPRAPINAITSPQRRPSSTYMFSDIKCSSNYNYISCVIAQARKLGADTALMLDQSGAVVDFATSNLIFTRNGSIFTPRPNGSFLDGITKKRVVWLLARKDIKVSEVEVSPEQIRTADEVISVSNASLIQSVRSIDGIDYSDVSLHEFLVKLYNEWALEEGVGM